MSKSTDWAERAGIQVAVYWRRNLPPPYSGARKVISGPSPARRAAAVGLVSPPGGIVLWDEWHARLNSRGRGENPGIPGRTETEAQKPRRRPKKEVRKDRNLTE